MNPEMAHAEVPTISKYVSGDVVATFLAKDADAYEIESLSSVLSSLSEQIIGGRLAVAHKTEIHIICSFLYHFLTLFKDGRTPGYGFYDLLVGREVKTLRRETVSPMTVQSSFYYSVLSSIGQYLKKRLPTLVPHVDNTISTLVADDDDDANAGGKSSNTRLSPILSCIALSLWQALGGNQVDRYKAVLKFLEDWNIILYFLNQRYPDIAFRILGLRVLSLESQSSRIRLRILAWIFLARMGISGVQLFSKFATNFRSNYALSLSSSAASPMETSRGSIRDELTAKLCDLDMKKGAPTGRKCALCRDVIHNAAITPCGHLHCWRCIIDYGMSQQAHWLQRLQRPGISDEYLIREKLAMLGANKLLCPVCRFELKLQQIRPVYGLN